MTELSAVMLSRIQFGFVMSFHIIFPAFTIGLASWLAFLAGMYLKTRRTLWRELYLFWLKIFAVSFALGVVSGIVMSFQFGTNWAELSARAGNILGPLLAYEVLTAFFLEATFLGVMLFGWRRVSPRLHFFATCMVALGTLISTFWIIMLGAIVQGMPLRESTYLGGPFGWFSPFSMLTGVAVVFGYALLGSTWLIMKTDGELQNIVFALTRPLVAVVVAFMGLVSTWLPFLSSHIMARWFESGNFIWLFPVPLLALVNAVALWRAVMRRADYMPFIFGLSFFALGFIGLVLGMWPNLLPPDLSIWEAAAPPSSQGFVLVGTLIMLPAVLGYTWWSYSVFRGKVAADAGYH